MKKPLPSPPVFHAFTARFRGRVNISVTRIHVSQAIDPKTSPIPPGAFHETGALWDTGATHSVVTEATARALGLIPNIAGSFGVIVGMDVISRGDPAITAVDGQTVMSFEHPSIAVIDVVHEAHHIKSLVESAARIGRNDLCPCGGKKYKNCYGQGKM